MIFRRFSLHQRWFLTRISVTLKNFSTLFDDIPHYIKIITMLHFIQQHYIQERNEKKNILEDYKMSQVLLLCTLSNNNDNTLAKTYKIVAFADTQMAQER